MEKTRAYVGITGAVTTDEVDVIMKEFSHAGYGMNSQHIPMFGFLASYKTLSGQPTENRRYPKVDDISLLARSIKNKALVMIHYNSKEMLSLADQVSALFEKVYCDGVCKAVQLNIVWPDVEQVRTIKKRFPELQIVFQASDKATASKTPEEIVDGIERYGDTLKYVLLDPSGGRGIEFDIDESVRVYEKIRKRMPQLTLGFAGGFTGMNARERVTKLIAKTGESCFCIDAEGGLRDKITSAYGDDLLNREKVKLYVHAAAEVLR